VEIGATPLLTNHILGRSNLGYTDFMPIALLFNEHAAYAVRGDSAIKNGRDLVEQIRRDPGGLSIAVGTTLGNANHISLAKVMRVARISRDSRNLKLVVFKSGGEAITALLGGHIDVLILTPSSIVLYVKSGALRIIATAASQRAPGILAQVPTWKEQGYDVVIDRWRAVFGPKGISRLQITFLKNVFARVS
jgi:putative tricarboxylic transport membrane protein